MRLLFINRYFYPDISATAQLLTELTEDLAAQGETVTVITGNTAYAGGQSALPAQEFHKGIRIVRVGFTRFGRTRTLGRLADYVSFWISAFVTAVRAKQQDCLVVLSDPPLLSVLAALVRMVRPIKTVCWLQDVFPEIAVRAGVLPEGLVARCLRWLARWSLRQMDQVVVIGRCMERQMLSDGVLSPSLTRIPNWADGLISNRFPKAKTSFSSGIIWRIGSWSCTQGITASFMSLRHLCHCCARHARCRNCVFVLSGTVRGRRS